jgi:Glycosyl transferases group 1
MPRRRRVVIDCDGAYNDAMCVDGDFNHRTPAASQTWMDVCDSLSDKVCQPTLHPLRPNVRTFFFHGYEPGWETALEFDDKEFGMLYIGHSKFRWSPMHRILQAVEPIRERVGRIGLVGHGWDSMPVWAAPMNIQDSYYTDPEYLSRMGVDFIQPIPVGDVISWMSKAVFNPVIYRPLFSHLRFVTCRTFETAAASTIPLFGLDSGYVAEMYGDGALTLVLPQDGPEEKVASIVDRPDDYVEVIRGVRRHLAEKHSYDARLRQLIDIVES